MLIWVAPISTYFFNYNLQDLFKKYILCINPSQLWFLWMLFDVFAIVWFFRKQMIEKPMIGWLLSFAFYGLGLIGKHIIPNVFCIWTACQYVIFFFLGMRIRIKNKEKCLTTKIPWWLWIILEVIVFAYNYICPVRSEIIWKILLNTLNTMVHAVGAIMAWTVLQKIASKLNWRDNNFFKSLSSYSMPMYLFHQQVIYFVIVLLNGVVYPWLNAGINFLVALIISWTISYFLMKYKITRFLIGEKGIQK